MDQARECLERLVGAASVAVVDGAFRLRTGPGRRGWSAAPWPQLR